MQIGPLSFSELYELGFALTVYFSAPSDTLAFFAAMFSFRLLEYLESKEVSEELTLRMEWDLSGPEDQLQVFIGKDCLTTFNTEKPILMGLNYLRIKSERGFSNINGLVSVDVSGR